MIGSRDAAAIEAAEIDILRREADARRHELGRTLEALAGRIASASLRGWAEAAAEWAAGQLRHAVSQAIRNSAPASGAAALTSLVAQRAKAAGPRKAAAAGVPAVAAAAAGWWLVHRARDTRR